MFPSWASFLRAGLLDPVLPGNQWWQMWGLGTACSAMPWEQHLDNRPTLVQRGCLDWLPEQGVSLVGVIADRDSEGTEHCNRILGRCAHFYSFETKAIPYGLNVVLMLRGVTKIDSRVTGSKYCVRDRDTSRR